MRINIDKLVLHTESSCGYSTNHHGADNHETTILFIEVRLRVHTTAILLLNSFGKFSTNILELLLLWDITCGHMFREYATQGK